MKLPHVPSQALYQQKPDALEKPDSRTARERASPEMIKAADGLEAHFTEMMMKAMRDTVEDSEFSLHNSATNIYQGMLDDEYAQTSARVNPLGLSDQILDYLLRSQPNAQYNKEQGTHPQPHHSVASAKQANQNVSKTVSNYGRTGGTNESK